MMRNENNIDVEALVKEALKLDTFMTVGLLVTLYFDKPLYLLRRQQRKERKEKERANET